MDIGHVDRTTLKTGLHLHLCNLSLPQTSLSAYCLQCFYELAFKLSFRKRFYVGNGFIVRKFLNHRYLTAALIHPSPPPLSADS